ncbi:hypothetical protein [Geomonas sp. Red276]
MGNAVNAEDKGIVKVSIGRLITIFRTFVYIVFHPVTFFSKKFPDSWTKDAIYYYLVSYALFVWQFSAAIKHIARKIAPNQDLTQQLEFPQPLSITGITSQTLQLTMVIVLPMFLILKLSNRNLKVQKVLNILCYVFGTANILFIIPIQFYMPTRFYHTQSAVASLLVFSTIGYSIILLGISIRWAFLLTAKRTTFYVALYLLTEALMVTALSTLAV